MLSRVKDFTPPRIDFTPSRFNQYLTQKCVEPNFYSVVQPSRDIKLRFGGLEGFWKFEDASRRQWNCELSVEGWRNLLCCSGFEEIIEVDSYGGANALILAKLGGHVDSLCKSSDQILLPASPTWLLFGDITENCLSYKIQEKLSILGNGCKVIPRSDVGSDTQLNISQFVSLHMEGIAGIIFMSGMEAGLGYKDVCEPFLYICKHLTENRIAKSLKLVTITNGCMSVGSLDDGVNMPEYSPVVAMVQALGNENNDFICKALDVDNGASVADEIISELFLWDKETMVAYRRGKRCVPRLRNYKVKNTSTDIPCAEKTRLVIPPTFRWTSISPL